MINQNTHLFMSEPEPEPEGPTDEELNKLMESVPWKGSPNRWGLQVVRAALARWGHQPAPLPEGEQRHPEPVPVSERLPGPKDCDAEGRCWFSIDGAQWALEDRTYGCNRHRTHWLPAHTLPLPAGEVEP